MYFCFFYIYLIDQTTTICGKPCRYSYMSTYCVQEHRVARKHSDCSNAPRNPPQFDMCVLASSSCRDYAGTQERKRRPRWPALGFITFTHSIDYLFLPFIDHVFILCYLANTHSYLPMIGRRSVVKQIRYGEGRVRSRVR